MKREFLEELGLEKEVIDKVMAENGKDIEAEKAKTKTAVETAETERDKYKEQLETAQQSLEAFKDVKPEELNQTIETLKKQLEDKEAEYKAKEADRAFKDSIVEAIKTAEGKNSKAIMALLDMDSLKDSKNQKEDIATAIEGIKKDNDYLFGNSEPFTNPTKSTGNSNTKDAPSALRAAMGLSNE